MVEGTPRGLGLAVAMPEQVTLDAARLCRTLGYTSFWLNNPPGTNALPRVAEAGQQIPGLRLGVGVIPLSDTSPEQIAERVRSSGVAPDRLDLGIGSGAGPGGVQRVGDGLRALRAALSCSLVVAALGPRMCALAGAQADGVLLNWLTPESARHSVHLIENAAAERGHRPRVIAYVRAALGKDARARLEREAQTYEQFPHYAAHFERMGVRAMDTAITGDNPEQIQEGLARWHGVVDEIVVRAIAAQEDSESLAPLVQAAAP